MTDLVGALALRIIHHLPGADQRYEILAEEYRAQRRGEPSPEEFLTAYSTQLISEFRSDPVGRKPLAALAELLDHDYGVTPELDGLIHTCFLSLIPPLRRELDCPVLDMDAGIRRINAGAWPDIAAKRQQTLQTIAEASRLEDVLVAYSVLDDEGLTLLREQEWQVALLDLPEAVMRSRAETREHEEGWSNVEWLPFHLDNIAHLRQMDAFTTVLMANRPVSEVVAAITALMRT